MTPRRDVSCAARTVVLIALVATVLAGCERDEEVSVPRVRRVRGSRETLGVSFEWSSTEDKAPPPTLSEMVEAGHHWRLTTPHGPVHVWIPKGYRARDAETIVYVHGFYVHVDDAWSTYRLPAQFASSAVNAMFIAPEAPASGAQAIAWESLAELLKTVETAVTADASAPAKMPKGRVVTIGHSGAWRTLLGWLDEPEIDTVVLVDAAYGEIDQYKKWILASDEHRLIDVGDDTREWTDKLHAELPDTYVLEDFPSLEDGIPREAQRARIVYIKSNMGHFPLVTSGTALPMLLRTLRAKRLVRRPLAEIIASGVPDDAGAL